MGDFDTNTLRGPGGQFVAPGAGEPDEGEVDLLVYCTVAVPITIATPYTDDELEEIAGHEIGWSAKFVSVDAVDIDAHDRAPGTIDPPRRPGHSFLDRLRRV